MRLLLVEDNASLSYILKRDLEAAGFSTEVAEDGEKGLYQCLNWSYDLILLDVNLPIMDGWEILKQLRAHGSNTPVIMLTANDSLDHRVKGLSSGADDYICKPFHFKELVARIMALHRRSANAPNNTLAIGNLTLHLDTLLLTCGNEETPLTSREFDILLKLAKSRGKIVSRNALFELFNEQETNAMASLDVHICNLRKKVGAEHIKTVRGKGYLLEA